jgi:hypothetical protein
LSAALEDKPGAQFREVRDLRDVEPDVLRQHRGQTGKDFVVLPPLALEAGDVGLQKHGAPVREHRHGTCGEGDLRIVLDAFPGDIHDDRETDDDGATATKDKDINTQYDYFCPKHQLLVTGNICPGDKVSGKHQIDDRYNVWKYGKNSTERTAKSLDGAYMLLRTMYMADFIKRND